MSKHLVTSGGDRSRAGCGGRDRHERGQGLVEFALVLTPLLLILLGIVQFGFIFNTYITMTNAARDAARLGTVYVYDRSLTKDQNDQARNNAIRSSLLSSMNGLSQTAPQFTSSTTWTKTGDTFTTGDLTITYLLPSGVTDDLDRAGQRITVSAAFHQDLLVPFIAAVLPRDSGGRMVLTGTDTMVMN